MDCWIYCASWIRFTLSKTSGMWTWFRFRLQKVHTFYRESCLSRVSTYTAERVQGQWTLVSKRFCQIDPLTHGELGKINSNNELLFRKSSQLTSCCLKRDGFTTGSKNNPGKKIQSSTPDIYLFVGKQRKRMWISAGSRWDQTGCRDTVVTSHSSTRYATSWDARARSSTTECDLLKPSDG